MGVKGTRVARAATARLSSHISSPAQANTARSRAARLTGIKLFNHTHPLITDSGRNHFLPRIGQEMARPTVFISAIWTLQLAGTRRSSAPHGESQGGESKWRP